MQCQKINIKLKILGANLQDIKRNTMIHLDKKIEFLTPFIGKTGELTNQQQKPIAQTNKS